MSCAFCTCLLQVCDHVLAPIARIAPTPFGPLQTKAEEEAMALGSATPYVADITWAVVVSMRCLRASCWVQAADQCKPICCIMHGRCMSVEAAQGPRMDVQPAQQPAAGEHTRRRLQ